jgi:hypothetical protein
MQGKIILALIILLLRTYIGIKVISWLILNFLEPQSHEISEIQHYLIIILLDIWWLGNSTQITINKEDEN